MTDLSPEAVIFLVGVIVGTLYCLASFCLLRIFISRIEYVLLGTYLVTLSSRFVDTTYLVASARGPLTVLILLTVFVVIEYGRRNNLRMLLIGCPLVVACAATHHMAIFLILFALAYVIVAIGQSHFNLSGPRGRLVRSVFYGAIALVLIVIVYGTATHFRSVALSSLGSTGLFDFEPRFVSVLANTLTVYTSQIGFIFPLAILGISYLLRRRSSTPLDLYPLAILIVFIPLVGYQIYVSLVVVPYIVVLGIDSLRTMFVTVRRKCIAVVVLVILIVSSLMLPFLLVDRWNDSAYGSGETVTVDAGAFDVANYCGHYYPGRKSISNGGVFNGLVESISGISFLGSGIRAVLTGDVTAEDIRNGLTPSDAEYPLNLYSWYEYNGDALSGYFQSGLVSGGIGYLCRGVLGADGEFREYLADHSRLVVYIDNNWPDSYVTSYGSSYSVFPSELAGSESACEYTPEEGSVEFAAYLVFESSRSSLYLVQLPIPETV